MHEYEAAQAKVAIDPSAGEDLPFNIVVRHCEEASAEAWIRLPGSTKQPPDTQKWGFDIAVETTVAGIERVVSQVVYAKGSDEHRTKLSTSWERIGDYEAKVEPLPKMRLAPWLENNPAWKREWLRRKAAVAAEMEKRGMSKASPAITAIMRISAHLAEGALGIHTCGTCKAFDRKTGRDELTKTTHIFSGTVSDSPGSQGATLAQSMMTDVAQMIAQQLGSRSLDPEKVGLCGKRDSLLEDDLLACPQYEV
jgi:hypothetical protein